MKTDLHGHIAEIARYILGPENKELSTRSELRFGNHGSVCVRLDNGTWFDHEHNVGGGVPQLIEVKGKVARADVLCWLRDQLGIDIEDAKPRRRRLVISYVYRDEAGNLLA